jgi:hypothetical protein
MALRFIFPHATSYIYYSSVTVYTVKKEKGGKPDKKPFPLPNGLRNPYKTLKIMSRNLNAIICS